MRRLLIFGLSWVASGCGYTLQSSHSPLLEQEGIHRIFISPMVNNTYKTGVENVVYNALLRTVTAHARVSLVSSPEQADAVLNGAVTLAETSMAATSPFTVGGQDRYYSSQYNAHLACTFNLLRRNPSPRQKGTVWKGAFDRVKPFVSAVHTGTRGETTALINDSEFDHSLLDLADSMVGDVHESMLAMF